MNARHAPPSPVAPPGLDPGMLQLLERSPFALAVHGEGRLLYANPACRALFRVPDGEVVDGRPFFDLVHPDARGAVRTRFEQIDRSDPSAQVIEARMRRLDDSDFDAVLAVALLEGQAAAHVVIQDISARKQAERALAESEDKFRTLVEDSPCIVFVRRGAQILYVNARATDVLGYTREEFTAPGFDMLSVIAPESMDVVRGALASRDHGIKVLPYTCTLTTRRGQRLHALLASANITLQGQPAILGVVTALAAAPAEATDARCAELERRLDERSAQLEAVNAELEAFVYSVSHDLRSPLHHINGFAEALLDEFGAVLGVQGQHYLARLRQGVEQMSGLIDDLLRLSRLSRAELQRLDIDLSALGRVIVDELLAAEPGRQVQVDIDDGMRVNADPNLLRVVLENLLGNALKFTRQVSAARIHLGHRRPEASDGVLAAQSLVYFVRDSGVGFDMKQADRLFTPFTRLHRQSDYPGHGVGLATAQRIVTRHGGRIWARSAPGEGATFAFTLSGDPGPAV